MEHLSKLFISTLLLPFYSSFLFAEEEAENDISVNDTTQTTFIDKTYHYLNSTFCQPAIWFDNFFVDDRISEDATADTMVRWYNDISSYESDGLKYKSRLNARVNLPKVSRKLKLVFESDNEEEPLTPLLPENEETHSQLGLRYDIYGKQRSSFNIKVTLRPGIEARYRYSYPLTAQTSSHFTQKIYQKNSLTGESSQLDLDHSITPEFLLRWSNFVKWETDIDGFKMGTGLTLYQYISPKQAINYKAAISGPDKPYRYIENSHLSVTYRQNILKKWLFYEITPEINWDKTDDTEREKEASITLRLEILFSNL